MHLILNTYFTVITLKKHHLRKTWSSKRNEKSEKADWRTIASTAHCVQGTVTLGLAALVHPFILSFSCSFIQLLARSSHWLIRLGTTVQHPQAKRHAWCRVGRWPQPAFGSPREEERPWSIWNWEQSKNMKHLEKGCMKAPCEGSPGHLECPQAWQ